MPELGKYADTVMSAYGASILLLVVMVLLSLRRGRKIRAQMEEIEQRTQRTVHNG